MEVVERVREAVRLALGAVEDDVRAHELTDDELASVARAAIEALRDFDFANSALWEAPLAYSDGYDDFRPPWKQFLNEALTSHTDTPKET